MILHRPGRIRVAAALVLALTLSACGAGMGSSGKGGSPSAEGPFNWRRYEGQTISVMLNEHPWTNGLKKHLPEFEQLTGIKVQLNTYSEDLYMDKMEQALRSSSPPGVYMVPMDDFAATQFQAGLMEPLTPFLNNPSLTTGDYDFSDFPKGLVDPAYFPAGAADARLYEIPISTESYILFYNKDLVNKYLGGVLPTTMQDLIAAAQSITAQGGGQVYGSVMRGVRSDTVRDTLTGLVLNEWPLDRPIQAPYNVWFDGSWSNPRLTDPSIVAGLSDYAKLLAAGPPNKFNIDWYDATALFQQGKVAFFIDASVFGPGFEDPSQSTVAGKVGYAPLPRGNVQGGTGVWSWGLAMGANAQNKGASWLFLQWATGKDMTAAIGASTGGAPRQSAATNPAYTAALNPDYVTVAAKAASTARTTAVIRANWKEGLYVIVDAMLAMANGQDPNETASKANQQMRSVIQ